MNRISKLFVVAMMVTLMLCYAAPAYAGGEVKGVIQSIDADNFQFVVATHDGQFYTFQMDEDAQVYINYREVQLNNLEEGDDVTVMFGPMRKPIGPSRSAV